MAITYPLTAPTAAIGPENITLRLVTADAISGSPFTFKQQVINLGGSRWEITVSVPPVNRDTAEQWIAFLLSLKGRQGTFLLGDPMAATSMGAYSLPISTYSTLQLNFSAQTYGFTYYNLIPRIDGSGQVGDTINVKGLLISNAEVFKPGDYIQIGLGSSATLHKVLTTTASDADGKASIDIAPALRSASVDNTTIVVSYPRGVFRLKSNETEWSIDKASKYGISFDAVEALT